MILHSQVLSSLEGSFLPSLMTIMLRLFLTAACIPHFVFPEFSVHSWCSDARLHSVDLRVVLHHTNNCACMHSNTQTILSNYWQFIQVRNFRRRLSMCCWTMYVLWSKHIDFCLVELFDLATTALLFSMVKTLWSAIKSFGCCLCCRQIPIWNLMD